MLALAQPAQAKIVYTKTHQKLLLKNPNFLDLNNDGVIDFSLILQSTYAPGVHTSSLAIGDYVVGGPNRIAGSTEGWASALRAGARIKSAGLARGDMEHVESNVATSSFRGNWANGGKGVSDRYLGLKFYIDGQAHYGWARLSVWFRESDFHHKSRIEGRLTGYAYETIPNKPIIAGKTTGKDVITVEFGSLGHLARGAR
jgi:hypothetical protein